MKKKFVDEDREKLNNICKTVRELVGRKEFEKSEELLKSIMGNYPHAAQPHNLFGILYEKEGKHSEAMKHFRAAWALDPTYLPAQFNMELYMGFGIKGEAAYEEADCLTFTEKKAS